MFKLKSLILMFIIAPLLGACVTTVQTGYSGCPIGYRQVFLPPHGIVCESASFASTYIFMPRPGFRGRHRHIRHVRIARPAVMATPRTTFSRPAYFSPRPYYGGGFRR